jgi:hypothetical protein
VSNLKLFSLKISQNQKLLFRLKKSGRVYLMLEPPNLPTLAEKIRANIQHRKNNIIKRFI